MLVVTLKAMATIIYTNFNEKPFEFQSEPVIREEFYSFFEGREIHSIRKQNIIYIIEKK